MERPSVHWRRSLENVRTAAREQRRLVLISLCDPAGHTCRQMDRQTFGDPAVAEYVQTHFVPVRFNVADQPEALVEFNTTDTPTMIVLDAEGREHRRMEGFLDPSQFLCEAGLARLKDAVDRNDYQDAYEAARELLDRAAVAPACGPEVRYWVTLAGHKAMNELGNLIQSWERMLAAVPGGPTEPVSPFARR